MKMLLINGDQGEGGGQILRTSLSLSLCLQRPFRIINIRRRRAKPGLRRQHLVAVEAAAKVSGAQVEGAEPGSMTLTFVPGPPQPGDYCFEIGSAGSTTLVLQTLLPALMTLGPPSTLRLEGGTHNPMAPPYDFLKQVFSPLLARIGVGLDATLEKAGFYPAGGGRLRIRIAPAEKLKPLSLLQRGRIQAIEATAMLGNLPEHIAQRELRVLQERLGLTETQTRVSYPSCLGQGNALFVAVSSEHITELFSSFGQRGVRAEKVAADLAEQVSRYLRAEVPVGQHLADQLLLPLALAGGGEFLTLAPASHTTTNIAVIEQFMGIAITPEQQGRDRWLICVEATP